MLSVKQLFSNPKYQYPKWMKDNAVFQRIDYVRKVFPDLGLNNFSDTLVVNNSREIMPFADALLAIMIGNIKTRAVKLDAFINKASRVSKKRRAELDLLSAIMGQIVAEFTKRKTSFATVADNNKINISLPIDLTFGDTIFLKKGAGLLKTYEKISKALVAQKCLPLEDLTKTYQFKNFSAVNLPPKEVKIVFSSEDENGIWDICTMSMRGVSSCQTWTSGTSNDKKLVGSMVDPFTGIIYMTSGTECGSFGTKMNRRCIVRYIIDSAKKQPYLVLEKMYPAFDQSTLNTFVEALQKRLPKGTEVLYTEHLGIKAASNNKLGTSYIPLSEELQKLEVSYYPYTDSGILFKNDPDCKYCINDKKEVAKFQDTFPTHFEKLIHSKLFTRDSIRKYGKSSVTFFKDLRDKSEDKKKALSGLSKEFTDFLCQNKDPMNFLKTHDKECKEFFAQKISLDLPAQDYLFSTVKTSCQEMS